MNVMLCYHRRGVACDVTLFVTFCCKYKLWYYFLQIIRVTQQNANGRFSSRDIELLRFKDKSTKSKLSNKKAIKKIKAKNTNNLLGSKQVLCPRAKSNFTIDYIFYYKF